MEPIPAVYILASKRNGTLYIGVTGNLVKRVWEHKHDLMEGFTRQYGVHTLVYFEIHMKWPGQSSVRSSSRNGTGHERLN